MRDHGNDAQHPRSRSISRRDFLERGAGLVGAAALGIAANTRTAPLWAEDPGPRLTLPLAVLGRTGLKVPVLGLGTALLGHQDNNKPSIPKLIDVFSDAIDRGLTYVDTGRIYGGAEEALATVLSSRREKVVIATKVWANTFEEAEKSFHESLRMLNLDHTDVLHLHSAGDKDIDRVLGDRGAWEFLESAKKAGKARFLGITGHSRPANFVRLLETGRVDVMMVAMNFVDRHIYGFEEKVLPVARKHKTGVLAMKVFGGVVGGFKNYSSKTPFPSQMDSKHHLDSIRYAKTLEGVTGLVIGAHSSEQVHKNIEMVLAAKPLSPDEFTALCERGKEIASGWTPRFGPVA
jgi:hypothetical protein